MLAWIDAFVPTFGLIALGYGLRLRLIRDGAVWAGLERLAFFVFLPCLLAGSIATLDLSGLPLGPMAATLWLTLLAGTASALALARLLGHDHAATTSVVQAGIRFNNYVAFAVAAGLFGQAGIAFGAVTAGLIVPFVQLILTLVFGIGRPQPAPARRVVLGIVTNPLLLGCLAGFAFAAVGGMPPGLGPTVRWLGQPAVAIGLLCVGAGLAPGTLREARLTQALVGAQKLVLMPFATLVLARLFGLPAEPSAVAVLFMAMPTAVTSYVMARAMGGDARLVGAAIVLQHLAAIGTLPLWALALVG